MSDSDNSSLLKAFASSSGHEAIKGWLLERSALLIAQMLRRDLPSEAILGVVRDLRANYDLLTALDLAVQDVQVFASDTIVKMQEREAAEQAAYDQAFEKARRQAGNQPLG